MRVPHRLHTLSARLTLSAVSILALFSLVAGYAAYRLTAGQLERTAMARLEALSPARQTAIDALLNHYFEQMRLFLQPDLEREVCRLLEARELSVTNRQLKERCSETEEVEISAKDTGAGFPEEPTLADSAGRGGP